MSDDSAPGAGGDPSADPNTDGGARATGAETRRATLRTSHDAPEVVAAALEPDDTDEMTTRVEDGQVVTTVVRPTTGGLRTTVDDYVVNCSVADRTVQHADRHTSSNP
jgi:hypothetical protein